MPHTHTHTNHCLPHHALRYNTLMFLRVLPLKWHLLQTSLVTSCTPTSVMHAMHTWYGICVARQYCSKTCNMDIKCFQCLSKYACNSFVSLSNISNERWLVKRTPEHFPYFPSLFFHFVFPYISVF